jgi:hypothetical protein
LKPFMREMIKYYFPVVVVDLGYMTCIDLGDEDAEEYIYEEIDQANGEIRTSPRCYHDDDDMIVDYR